MVPVELFASGWVVFQEIPGNFLTNEGLLVTWWEFKMTGGASFNWQWEEIIWLEKKHSISYSIDALCIENI